VSALQWVGVVLMAIIAMFFQVKIIYVGLIRPREWMDLDKDGCRVLLWVEAIVVAALLAFGVIGCAKPEPEDPSRFETYPRLKSPGVYQIAPPETIYADGWIYVWDGSCWDERDSNFNIVEGGGSVAMIQHIPTGWPK